jgi:competence ComEA-like helix-hairpin-helix protein
LRQLAAARTIAPMGELYDDSIFKKREEAMQKQAKSQNLLFIGVIILVLLVAGGAYLWKLKFSPENRIININKASVEELQYLPGVGPAVAKDIVKGRPYKTPEDLKNVKGIGDKTYEKMAPRVKVE